MTVTGSIIHTAASWVAIWPFDHIFHGNGLKICFIHLVYLVKVQGFPKYEVSNQSNKVASLPEKFDILYDFVKNIFLLYEIIRPARLKKFFCYYGGQKWEKL